MDLLNPLRDALSAQPAVATAWLFGSRARGTERPDSDVDVAVLWRDPTTPLEAACDLEAALSMALQLPVQITVAHRAPADLVRRILRDGHLIVDLDRVARVAFEVRKRNEYFDMTPIWRQIRRLPPGVDP